METGGLILLCAILVIAAYFFGRVGYAIENDKKEKSDDVEINEPVKNDNCNRVIYLLIRNSYYANDLKTLKRIYELLVAEGIIDEFQIDKDIGMSSKTNWVHLRLLIYSFLKTLNTILL